MANTEKNPVHVTVDCKTNTVTEVELTAEEIAQLEINAEKLEVEFQAKETAQAKKDADAKAGNDKLIELGLSQDQVTAMTGYTPPSE